MERGYVKLWRKTLDSGLLTNPTALQVFIYLMLNATRNAKKMVVYGEVLDLQPGDYVTGRKKLAEALNISEQNVRTAMSLLERLRIVTSKSTNKYTIVSLVKWNTYQEDSPTAQPADQPAGNQRLTSDSPAGNQRVTTKQERENERKRELKTEESQDKSCSSSSGRGARTKKAGFVEPTRDEVEAYIIEKNYDVDPDEFMFHYQELGWVVQGKPMKSWRLALSTWNRNERARAKNEYDPAASKFSTPRDTPEMRRQFMAIHKDYDGIIHALGNEGRWDLVAKYEDMVVQLKNEVRMGIPYTPADEV